MLGIWMQQHHSPPCCTASFITFHLQENSNKIFNNNQLLLPYVFFFLSQIPALCRQIVSSRSFLMGHDAIPATCPLQWGAGVSSNMVKSERPEKQDCIPPER
ncbi:hypothetical protein CDAR_128191 [Caerostris darwini]|uniref:Uncharacterized protein n=1 Tax=Caerostris darwini TaxID=1538125 RepID=A0AAV4UTE7_9ARAC|nr:hypothetical protein CDAR_128191 [Caerostris darwini]